MEFRKIIKLPTSSFQLTHKHNIMLMGSCFAQHIASKFERCGFNAHQAIGVLYNPKSISNSLYQLLNNEQVAENKLFFDREKWQNFDFPSQYTNADKQESLSLMQVEIAEGHTAIVQAKALIITFGTAYVYEQKDTHNIVANCHRVDAKHFTRRRLSIEEIVKTYKDLILALQQKNSELKIIFTVSPVRHWKDGAHGNQISKSILMLAIEQICLENSNCLYFPSYEIMMDELRDYRFYKSDMLHPNETAINYIWEQFSNCFFNKKTTTENKVQEKKWKQNQHRPHLSI